MSITKYFSYEYNVINKQSVLKFMKYIENISKVLLMS